MFPEGALLFFAAENTVDKYAEGGYAKKILALSLDESNSSANKAFLTKVLAAVKLDLFADALFLEIPPAEPVNCFAGLSESPEFILAFGLSPAQIGLQASMSLYQPFTCNNATWLFADALSSLEPDRDKKSKLWSALKTMFGV